MKTEVNLRAFQKEDTEAILEKTEKDIFGLLQNRNRMSDFVPIQDIVLNSLSAIEEASKTKGRVTGVATGFTELDYKLTGLHPAELILVAARPAMGKTAFVLNIAQYAAFKDNHAVAMFSLEMSKEQLVTRLMASESMVDSQQMRTGDLRDSDWEKLLEALPLSVIQSLSLMIQRQRWQRSVLNVENISRHTE